MRYAKQRVDKGLSTTVLVLVWLPLLSLVWQSWQTDFEQSWHTWRLLLDYVLVDALINTLILLLGVAVCTFLLGFGAAWLVSAFDFKGRRFLSWALLLPLAIPTYIIAYTYIDMLHPIAWLQSSLREILGYTSPRDWRLPDIRTMGGAIVLFSLVLYPYVYMGVRVMLARQSAKAIEVAKTLGSGSLEILRRIVLPMLRPAIAVGVSLALLETLNDVGASEMLGVKTLTLAIYDTWISKSDWAGAAQIALTSLSIVLAVLWLEQLGRRKIHYAESGSQKPWRATPLRSWRAFLALVLGLIPVVFGFALPIAHLVYQSLRRLSANEALWHTLWQCLLNSLQVALWVSLLCVSMGMLLAWTARARKSPWLMRLGNIGYAIPGTVLAIGMMAPLLFIDRVVGELFNKEGLWLMAGIAGLVLAGGVRFLSIASGNIESGLLRISPHLEQSARVLGDSPWRCFWRVQLPMLRPAIAVAALLVFVDSMKELPMALLLRPINFETLATWLYAEAARGSYEEGAVAALLIVLVGIIPVVLLTKTQLDDVGIPNLENR